MVYGAYFFSGTPSCLIVIRLCVETPPAGGRVFEKGDEYLLRYAHEIQRALFSCILIH